MSEIKAIETEYAGCRFRSRLEARWAVFFDALGMEWRYEEEGYELPSGRYLPDFRLIGGAHVGNADVWVEVKGKLTYASFMKVSRAAIELPEGDAFPVPHPKLLVLGEVPEPGWPWAHVRLDAVDGLLITQQVRFVRAEGDGPFTTRVCADPYGWRPKLFELPSFRENAHLVYDSWLEPTVDASGALCGEVDEAYRAARSARFEFGERG